MRLKKKFFVSVSIILGTILLIGTTVYSTLFTCKDVDIELKQKDYKSGLQKLNSLSRNDYSNTKKQYENLKEISLTNEEMSSILTQSNIVSTVTQNFMPEIKYIKVNYLENNEVEAVLKLNKLKSNKDCKVMPMDTSPTKKYTKYFMNMATKVPVYTKFKVKKESAKEIHIDLYQIELGRVPIPESMLKAAQTTVNNKINGYIKQNNIVIEKILFKQGKMHYKGIIPNNIDI